MPADSRHDLIRRLKGSSCIHGDCNCVLLSHVIMRCALYLTKAFELKFCYSVPMQQDIFMVLSMLGGGIGHKYLF